MVTPVTRGAKRMFDMQRKICRIGFNITKFDTRENHPAFSKKKAVIFWSVFG
jgi:hypothetical protein